MRALVQMIGGGSIEVSLSANHPLDINAQLRVERALTARCRTDDGEWSCVIIPAHRIQLILLEHAEHETWTASSHAGGICSAEYEDA